jgi:4-amino-4-deoxy-L-arabinose transferase-like glycosyltransferase
MNRSILYAMSRVTSSLMAAWLYQHRYSFLIGLILLGYTFNLFIDIMEIDAAQYAALSREMAESGNYLQVHFRGTDYLDKPPLLFWISSVGISLFGNTSMGYKIFPVLLLVLGLYATFRFTRLWYDHRTAVIAVLLLGSTQAFSLMSNDVRTDGLLTTFTIMSVWLLSDYVKHKNSVSLLFGGLCIGGAMLAKGPLGLFIPAAAIGGHLLFSGQWKKIFDPHWLLLIPVIALVLAPMCYGLYMQFDMHPEKDVYGMKGPSGLRFYFWTQSFGRITGESQWNNNAPWYFLLQTMLWDLQPWVLVFIPAIWFRVKEFFSRNKQELPGKEWITLCGFIIPFVALSFSAYKLPHYIFPLFPFAAVIMASWMVSFAEKIPQWLEYLQLGLMHLLAVAAVLMMAWVFPVTNIWLPLLWLLLYAGIWWWRSHAQDAVDRWILPSLMGVFAFQWILSLHFYPQLLKYQAGSQAGKWIETENPERVYWHDEYDYSLDYYSDRVIPNAYGPPVDTLPPGTWIYVTENALPTMPPNRVIRVFDQFPATRVSLKFLNPATRKEKLQKMYLIELIIDN